MPAHWHSRFAPTPVRTLCRFWAQDGRLARKLWLKREATALIKWIGEVVWAQKRGKGRAER